MRLVNATTLLISTLALSLLGCQKDEAAEPPMMPASRALPAAERAIEEIASMRCDHEQLCGRIGSAAAYPDREHCRNAMRVDARGELGRCRTGIDQGDLQECLGEIADGDCDGPLGRLETIPECKIDDLCID